MEPSAGSFAPGKKQKLLFGPGLRPGVRRWGRGGQSRRPSRWRAKRTLTAACSANRWGGCRDVGRSPASAEGASRWLSRGAGISEVSGGVAVRAVSRGSGTDRGGIFRGAEMGGAVGERLLGSSALGMCRERSCPAGPERERSPEEPGPAGQRPMSSERFDHPRRPEVMPGSTSNLITSGAP